jgi:hypothetical protein
MRSGSGTLAAFAMVILVSAGCGASTTPSASRPTDQGSAGSPAMASPDPGSPTASPSTWPTITPLSASWVKPAADATIKDYKLDLAATTVGVASEVTFKVGWSTGSFAGCSSEKPSSAGTWSCTVDLLKAGVPPGKLKASFDVLDRSGKSSANLAPSRTITYAAAPPKPVTTYKVVSQKYASNGSSYVETDKLTWTEPAGYATEFRLYGVKGCPNASSKTDGQACLVENMSLPKGTLELVKKMSGSTRSVTLTHTIPEGECGGTIWCGAAQGDFGALVLGAYNAYGQSVFAIVLSTDVCYQCVY